MNRLPLRHCNRWALCLAVLVPAALNISRAIAQEERDEEESPPPAACGANAAGENILGLYVSAGNCSDPLNPPQLDPRLRKYTPQYELWSDAADKERYILLPQQGAQPTEDEKIDTADPDRWKFPKGTVLYKTFLRDGKRIETRKIFFDPTAADGAGEWLFQAFAWSEDQATTELHEGGPAPIKSTHYIPTNTECFQCHQQYMGGADPILGFGAIQLNHAQSETTLASIAGFLKNTGSGPNVTPDTAVVPGVAGSIEQRGLGYLHGNCSNCHGGEEGTFPTLRLWTRVGETTLTETSPIMSTGVCQCLEYWKGRTHPTTNQPYTLRIKPGDADMSAVTRRMSIPGVFGRQSRDRMPPIATIDPHTQGIEQVSAWINSLPANMCNKICQ